MADAQNRDDYYDFLLKQEASGQLTPADKLKLDVIKAKKAASDKIGSLWGSATQAVGDATLDARDTAREKITNTELGSADIELEKQARMKALERMRRNPNGNNF